MPEEETIEAIEAEADAMTTEHLARRLHEVLSRAFAARLAEIGPPAAGRSAGFDDVDPVEVEDLKALLRATRAQLKATQAELRRARSRRDDLLRQVAAAEERMANARRRVAGAVPDDDPYIRTVLEVSDEILRNARAMARRIVEEAKVDARDIRIAAGYCAELSVRHVNAGPRR
nr:hypothetical protein [uncultured Actinoplanes sp.]